MVGGECNESSRAAAIKRTDMQRGPARLAVWTWGDPDRQPLLLVHGWGDTGAGFQFIANFLAAEYFLIAPDLRGFGESDWNPDGYWFPDYLADLDAVIARFCGTRVVGLIGHSMGGNIAGLLAGVRPERFSHLVLLEGFGLPPTTPAQAPERYRRWLDGLRREHRLRDFDSTEALQAHLAKLAPRAPHDALTFLATHWARPLSAGGWRLKMDPAHKRVNPSLYRRDEATACRSATTASVLLVSAAESDIPQRFPRFDLMTEIATDYRNVRQCRVTEAGHMLHWEQPHQVASVIRAFLANASE